MTLLVEKGYVRRAWNQNRSIELTESESAGTVRLPLRGTIAAGRPLDAVPTDESLSVPADMVRDRTRSYVLQVQGDSMIDDQIRDGDFVVIEDREARGGGETVVALIDAGCFSTTDNFLRALRDLHPAFTTVGRATGAGTGAPRAIATLTHSGARITLCTMRVLGPRSGLIEGRGTQPDVPVTWTRADVIAGRDPDLEAALRLFD